LYRGFDSQWPGKLQILRRRVMFCRFDAVAHDGREHQPLDKNMVMNILGDPYRYTRGP
jgi:hypothetical protein